jgi:NADH-quinone oxidoreductase subunit L
MSQIGYMMMALGVSGYGSESGLGFMASMFHLFTHSFFKALLFLGAGSIIHAVHSNDLGDMGGLRKYMPITHITFLIACLAIAGIPPFAGFFSKDEILVAAFAANKLYFTIGFLVAGLTAFYMFRLYFSIFWNKEAQGKNLHESPKTMTIPLILLAIGSTFAGFVPFNNLVTSDGLGFDIHMHWNVALASIGIGVLGIAIAYVFYKKESELPDKAVAVLSGIYRSAYNKFYIDELYIFITKRIIFKLISSPVAWFDRNIVDGFMNALAAATDFISNSIKEFQSGQLQKYAFVFLSGVILLLLTFVYILN